MNCTGITELNLPDSVTFIGEQAFMYCEKLNDIYLYGNITKIEVNAFNGCMSIPLLMIPKSVNYIGFDAF